MYSHEVVKGNSYICCLKSGVYCLNQNTVSTETFSPYFYLVTDFLLSKSFPSSSSESNPWWLFSWTQMSCPRNTLKVLLGTVIRMDFQQWAQRTLAGSQSWHWRWFSWQLLTGLLQAIISNSHACKMWDPHFFLVWLSVTTTLSLPPFFFPFEVEPALFIAVGDWWDSSWRDTLILRVHKELC